VGEPPPLPRDVSRGAWILIGTAFGVVGMWITGAVWIPELGIWFNEQEGVIVRWIADHRVEWLTDVLEVVHEIGYTWLAPLAAWMTMLLLVSARRLRHLLVYFAGMMVTSYLVLGVAPFVGRSRPWRVEQLAAWDGFSHPSLPAAQLTAVLVGASYALVPGARNRARACAVVVAALALFGISRVYLGVEYPLDPINGTVIGAAIMAAGFLFFCPEAVFPVGFQRGRRAHLDTGGARGEAIRVALGEQLGVDVVDLAPVGLEGSAGSTPMRVTVEGDPRYDLFAKLYAASHLRSDRWYKIGRELRYGRLEDESRFENVRRLVEHEDYLMRRMHDAGITAPKPLGIVTITPEREYLLVTEYLAGAEELTHADIDDETIAEGLELVRRMWDNGLAHRDIKPANVMIRDGHVYRIDVSFAQVRPSAWREAVDLANMMMALALHSTTERVYEIATRFFTPEEIAEAFAATSAVTVPGQLRSEIAADGRDLLAEFRCCVPTRPKVPVQRWTLRRVALALWLGALAALVVVLGVGNLTGIGLL
jgi:tRNA A-37 threonylcarbamoyl transferase component Bud32/membrane-associated phospholipid phosphatase